MALLPALLLGACSNVRDDDSPRIKSLQNRSVVVQRSNDIEGGREEAIKGYRDFLNTSADDSMKVEALRRLGDLQMENAEDKVTGAEGAGATGRKSTAASDYRDAIRLYQELLRSYPQRPGNDRVLYQLSHAYEQVGDLDGSLNTLTRLITSYPNTPGKDEVQFRRGEFLFSRKSYVESEQAYRSVVGIGDSSTYYEKALNKLGWSLFKQSRYDEGLDTFFMILDRKLAGRDNGGALSDIPDLAPGDRELVEDTFNIMSISFSYLEGATAIKRYSQKVGKRDYEYRLYQHLGALYVKQERIKDAADTYIAFTQLYPNNPQSALFQVMVIDAYKQAGFATQELDAKKDFVINYGINSAFRKANDEQTYNSRVVPHLKKNLEDLARHYHASAQKTHAPGDYREAARWYQAFLESFPADPQAPAMNFLLAEMLYEDKRYGEAAIEYEKTAYQYKPHAKTADAGYSALLAYAAHEKLLNGKELNLWRQRSTESALRFADTNPNDRRTPAVLTQAAERLYADHSPDRAALAARSALAKLDQFKAERKEFADPKIEARAENAMRRTAWTVIANTEFERGGFKRAEEAYLQAMQYTPAGDKERSVLNERLAASVYKQGEQSRSVGDLRGAIGHFTRVAGVAPGSAIRVTAEYDAAATLITLKDWNGAVKVLEGFRKAHPNHPLQAEVTNKLAVAYMETGQLTRAAGELEALADTKSDPQVRRAALWQVAELYEKAKDTKNVSRAYQRYLHDYPRPLEPAIEARQRLAGLYEKTGQNAERMRYLNEIIQADQAGGKERTDRTRFLAATASLALAEPVYQEYQKMRLVEPLKKNLKLKKEKMQGVLKAYGAAADYGVEAVATASTYRIAEIYNDFGRELLASQRPKGLSPAELEQYDVLLEEQAYPFEEKAIEVHEINVQRTAQGVYDEWVKNSFKALGKLQPVRYAKTEKAEGVVHDIR
jgi:outer membrane protein assembly factor BamD (BamD/ComL family)